MIPRLAAWCFKRRRLTLLMWIVFVVVAVSLGTAFKGDNRADYGAPGSDSKHASDVLSAHEKERAGDTFDIVVDSPQGTNDAAVNSALTTFESKIREIKDPTLGEVLLKHVKHDASTLNGVVSFSDPRVATTGPSTGKVEVITVLTNYDPNLQALHFGKDLIKLQKATNKELTGGAHIELAGQIPGSAEQKQSSAEVFGFIAAIVILFIAFGSLLAMGVPIFVAILSLTTATGLVGLIMRVVPTPDWAPIIASMIGIGVGIDYALFIVTRYRTGLKNGLAPRDAVVVAMNTAGRAVMFAGCTVVISLLGLSVMKQGYLYGVAVAASTSVLVVMLASITLLPAILGFVRYKINGVLVQNPDAGPKASAIGRFFYKWTGLFPLVNKLSKGNRGVRIDHAAPSKHNTPEDPNSFWHRWSHAIQRRPWFAVMGALIVLAVLTTPLKDLHLGFPDAGNSPKELTSRKAYDIETKAFGKGSGANIYVVAELASPSDISKLGPLQTALSKDPGLVFATPPKTSADGQIAIIVAQPSTSPQDKATETTVKRLRTSVIPPAVAGTGVRVSVGGLTAGFIDSSRYIADRLILFIGAVVVLSFLLLMVVFRSIFVPIKAAVMNLLSISAAYGVMSFAVNGTWLGRMIGIPNPTPIPSFVPMIMFAILFGLSMDYEVFLLSRVREEYLKTRDNATAVADGLAATARVITAAAGIMFCVFFSFVLDPNTFVKAIGLGLATAILVDASIIRLLLVPATMELLGDLNWWYPKWLDRITPHFHIDSEDVVDLAGETSAKEPALSGSSN